MKSINSYSLYHISEESGEKQKLLTSVDIADTLFTKVKGQMATKLIGRSSGLAFTFESAGKRYIHTFLVPYPLGVLWIKNQTVTKTAKTRPWVGMYSGYGDSIIELHPDLLQHISVGDTVYLIPND